MTSSSGLISKLNAYSHPIAINEFWQKVVDHLVILSNTFHLN